MRDRRMTRVLAVLLLAIAFAACSEEDSEPQGSPEESSSSPVEEDSPAPSAPAEEPDNLVVASDFRFNTDKMELVAAEKTMLPFVNNDVAPHNISIYVSKGGKTLFEGKSMGSGERTTYQIPPLDKGRYYFVCDLHPPMEGTVVVR